MKNKVALPASERVRASEQRQAAQLTAIAEVFLLADGVAEDFELAASQILDVLLLVQQDRTKSANHKKNGVVVNGAN